VPAAPRDENELVPVGPTTPAVEDNEVAADIAPVTRPGGVPVAAPAVPARAVVPVAPLAATETTGRPDLGVELAAPVPSVPSVPAANGDGTFSLARQLGLGISRIVIDPGHGGHDPGTLTSGSSEARLVLDVALRLERLLKKEPGLEVVLTRRTDVFVPLEQRTAIANRESADLFLSIHANASRDPKARGLETYFLSFASNPEAEAVAARENATSASDMHNLPSIVRAIALNNKLDESRDLAHTVQQTLAGRLAKTNVGLRSRGVKKAPFVVLIGAVMPSVLAEIGFITNKQEAALIKTPAYRQKIAEALHAAVLQYRRSLKRQTAVAAR
jgi:N-acetylmuramoyl-L-alanine amidase